MMRANTVPGSIHYLLSKLTPDTIFKILFLILNNSLKWWHIRYITKTCSWQNYAVAQNDSNYASIFNAKVLIPTLLQKSTKFYHWKSLSDTFSKESLVWRFPCLYFRCGCAVWYIFIFCTRSIVYMWTKPFPRHSWLLYWRILSWIL